MFMQWGKRIVSRSAVVCGLSLLSFPSAFSHGTSVPVSGDRDASAIKPILSKLTMPFISNQGQMDSRVAFYAPTFAGTVYVTKTGQIVYSVPARTSTRRTLRAVSGSSVHSGWVLTESLITPARLVPMSEGASMTNVNSFIGNDKSDWRSGLASSRCISLGEAWPGITVSLEAHGDSVEKLYTVLPRAKVGQIRLAVSGAKQLHLQQGKLVAQTDEGPLTFSAPRAWQEIGGIRHPVQVDYTLQGHEYGFRLGSHASTAAVVIDPDFQATFLGGSDGNWDVPMALALDASGDVYLAGYTVSKAFPGTTGGAQPAADGVTDNAFIAKLNSDLSVLEQATYLGGSGQDYPFALVVSPSGDVYLGGETSSTDFPGTAGGAQIAHDGTGNDGFVARLNGDLTVLEQSTYLGGSSTERIAALALDGSGDVYVGGYTSSMDFPGTAGGAQTANHGTQDAFIAKLNAGLTTLEQATYLGGNGTEFTEDLAIDQAGDVYIAGYTYSKDMPGTSGGAQPAVAGGTNGDVFIAKLNPALTVLEQATYLGGSSDDYARGMAIDSSGDVYVAGDTYSLDFPGTSGGAQAMDAGAFGTSEVFVAKLNAGLTSLDQSTYLGTSSNEWAYSITLGPSGDVYVAGPTVSMNFPGTGGGAQATYDGGSSDVYIAKFNASLTTLEQATYFGGAGMDETGFGRKLAINAAGDTYVAGDTNSRSLPGTDGSYQTANNEGSVPTGFIVKFPADLKAQAGQVVLNLSLGAPTQVAPGDSIQYSLVVTDNSSATTATGVTLVDTLPAQVSFVSAVPSQGSCNFVNGVVTCALGSLASKGGNAGVSITVAATESGTAVDSAQVSADQGLDSSSISTASVNTSIRAPLSISSIANQVTTPGQTLNSIPFTLTGSGTLTVTGGSSNPELLPAANLVFSPGCGNNTLACTLGLLPVTGQIGSATVILTVTDSFGGKAQTSFELTVDDVAPIANHVDVEDSAGVAVNGFLSATTSYSGQTLNYSLVSPASHGTLVITNVSTGAFTYSPNMAYAGSDDFTYQATDAFGTPSNTGAATVTVNDIAAVAKNGSVGTSAGMIFSGTLFAVVSYPGQTLNFQIASPPVHGSVQLTNALTGAFRYTPATGFVGQDNFTFVAIDAYGTLSNTATESITVNSIAPTANNGSVNLKFTGIVRGQLSAIPAYPGQSFVYQIVTQPGVGSLQSFDPNTGAFEYKPKEHFLGTDSFTFDVVDSSGDTSNVATETITLTPNNPGAAPPRFPSRPCKHKTCNGGY